MFRSEMKMANKVSNAAYLKGALGKGVCGIIHEQMPGELCDSGFSGFCFTKLCT